MRILVTEASGLLGSKLVEILLRKGYAVYAGYNENKPKAGLPVKLDVSNEGDVERAFEISRPEVVVHAAALTNVDACELNKELAWSINVVGTRNIVKLSKKYSAFLIYISTDYVFKGDKGMYSESDPTEPVNYYGYTKLKGEEEVRLLEEHCIARTSVIYGSIPAAGKVNFALWVIDKLRKGEKVRALTDQWNSPTLNVNLAEMIVEIAERRLLGTFHLAGATRISRYDFARLIARKFNLDERLIQPIASNEISWIAQRPRDSSLNVEKASRTLKIKPLDIHRSLEILRSELECHP
ncbi:dTDP-4-dehydrorhamnose reductase [Candidatus Methanodesulfokora washburnensis]|uniref:dTDP-4-dehydrorhamnose reductase n=1 Tax=Candidatus Methanodesulfokora washburnensis TaxID=2478471 RepID=A0A429GTR6_9CREN|nr:dTDP-4-dehydrorhamnose reductase [Candidatus Methanodesulfokores washburnensis]RSN77486.1 dTDP-4-dehydrorhamnose reductase [Candidatus Methanodesulfokores washburnensis]